MRTATAPTPTASQIAPSSQAIRLRNKPANSPGGSTRQSAKQQPRQCSGGYEVPNGVDCDDVKQCEGGLLVRADEECPAPCVSPYTRTRACPPPDADVEQTQERPGRRDVLGQCVYSEDWTDWAPACPTTECSRWSQLTLADRWCPSLDTLLRQQAYETYVDVDGVCVPSQGPWRPECPGGCDGVLDQTSYCMDTDTERTRSRTVSREGETCVYSDWSAWVPAQCPVPDCSPVVEREQCEFDPAITRTRELERTLVDGACVDGTVGEWDRTCPPRACVDVVERDACEGADVERERSRPTAWDGEACAPTGDWSGWAPAQCPAPCEPDILTRRCETDFLIEQRDVAPRSRGTDGECSVLGVRRWEPECPPPCESLRRKLECEGSDVVQVQERPAVRVGGVCEPAGNWSVPHPECPGPVDPPSAAESFGREAYRYWARRGDIRDWLARNGPDSSELGSYTITHACNPNTPVGADAPCMMNRVCFVVSGVRSC